MCGLLEVKVEWICLASITKTMKMHNKNQGSGKIAKILNNVIVVSGSGCSKAWENFSMTGKTSAGRKTSAVNISNWITENSWGNKEDQKGKKITEARQKIWTIRKWASAMKVIIGRPVIEYSQHKI